MIRRMLAVFYARNLEFLRDRGTVIWNLLLPILLVVGLGLVFGGGARPLFEVGVLHAGNDIDLKASRPAPPAVGSKPENLRTP